MTYCFPELFITFTTGVLQNPYSHTQSPGLCKHMQDFRTCFSKTYVLLQSTFPPTIADSSLPWLSCPSLTSYAASPECNSFKHRALSWCINPCVSGRLDTFLKSWVLAILRPAHFCLVFWSSWLKKAILGLGGGRLQSKLWICFLMMQNTNKSLLMCEGKCIFIYGYFPHTVIQMCISSPLCYSYS